MAHEESERFWSEHRKLMQPQSAEEDLERPETSARMAVAIDEPTLSEDLGRLDPDSQAALGLAFDRIRDRGADLSWLIPSSHEQSETEEQQDCVYFCAPPPYGQLGAVCLVDYRGSKPCLLLIATGDLVPVRPWIPTIFELASMRLNRGQEPREVEFVASDEEARKPAEGSWN